MEHTCAAFSSVLDVEGWESELSDVPAMSDSDVKGYFRNATESCARQTERGWTFKEEKFIRNVQTLANDVSSCYIRSTCLPSMKSGFYRQLLLVQKDPVEIRHAFCECTAGLSQTCQHIAGLLYALVAIKTPSCTDVSCAWVAPTNAQKRPPPSEISKICFWKVEEGKAAPEMAKQRSSTRHISPPTDEELVARLISSLQEGRPNVPWLRYATDEGIQRAATPPLPDTEDLLSKKAQSLFDKHFADIRSLNMEEIEKIRITTIGQAENDKWFAERKERLTASKFKRAVKCRKPENLVREIMYPEKQTRHSSLRPNDPRRYGLEMEPVAVNAYRQWCRNQGKDTVVTPTGLHIHERYPFLAASPDGLVHEEGGEGLLEVKCPQSKFKKTPTEACSDKKFCCTLLNDKVTLKKEHAFYYQVQGQLVVTGYCWCDFVIYTHNETLEKSIAVERIYLDPDFCATHLLPGLLYFYRRAVIPEILTKRIKRMNLLYTTGPGYLPFETHLKGYYQYTVDDKTLRATIRKL